jgi:hypothetical protein
MVRFYFDECFIQLFDFIFRCDDGDVLNNKNDVDVVLDTTNDVNDDSGFESATGGGCFVHDGDNSVALTDAWANIVWEPRRYT